MERTIDNLLYLYVVEKISQNRLAEIFGITKSQVKDVVDNHGFNRDSSGGWQNQDWGKFAWLKTNYSQDEIKQLIRDYIASSRRSSFLDFLKKRGIYQGGLRPAAKPAPKPKPVVRPAPRPAAPPPSHNEANRAADYGTPVAAPQPRFTAPVAFPTPAPPPTQYDPHKTLPPAPPFSEGMSPLMMQHVALAEEKGRFAEHIMQQVAVGTPGFDVAFFGCTTPNPDGQHTNFTAMYQGGRYLIKIPSFNLGFPDIENVNGMFLIPRGYRIARITTNDGVPNRPGAIICHLTCERL